MRLGRKSIHVLMPGIVMDRGQRVEDWSKPSRRTVAGCSVQPGEGERDFSFADGVTASYTVFCPINAGIDPRARLELPGESGQFIQVSPPERWDEGPRASHVRLRLRKRDG